MELAGWVKLVNQSAGHQQQAQAEHLARECLQRSRIRAYHCTRLLASEVGAIKRDGLRPATSELARDKSEAASAAGRALPFGTQADPSNKIWFYHRRADLQAATSGALFRSWGGKELLATSRGVVDPAAKPYIIAVSYPVSKLKCVFGRGWCAVDTKIINQYLAQSSPVAPEDTAFESCIDESVAIEANDIIPAADVRFSALTDYCHELHFHAA